MSQWIQDLLIHCSVALAAPALEPTRKLLQVHYQHIYGDLWSRTHRLSGAPPGTAEHECEGSDLEPALATPRGAEPPAGGSAPRSAETVVESPSGVRRRTGREPTARPRRPAGADAGKDLLDEIVALKEQQKKAKEEKRRSRKSCETPIVVARG